MGRQRSDTSLTLRVDPDVVTWARMRAMMQGTSVNRVLTTYLEAYARVPERWWDHLPPPWDDKSPGERAREPDPVIPEHGIPPAADQAPDRARRRGRAGRRRIVLLSGPFVQPCSRAFVLHEGA